MRFFSWLETMIFGTACARGVHHAKELERLRIERAGGGRFSAGAVLESCLVCRDCGFEIVPWHDVAPPMDAIALGVQLEPAEWYTIATGGKLFFLPDGADTFNEGVENAEMERNPNRGDAGDRPQ